MILGIPIRRIAGNKAQVTLVSGSVSILTFKEGKFAGVNTMSSKTTEGNFNQVNKKGAVLSVASCSEKDELIALEQQCTDFQNCAQTVTLSKGNNQHIYEVTKDRGVTIGKWILFLFVCLFILLLSKAHLDFLK